MPQCSHQRFGFPAGLLQLDICLPKVLQGASITAVPAIDGHKTIEWQLLAPKALETQGHACLNLNCNTHWPASHNTWSGCEGLH
jgi:hypothetical protein